MSKRNRRHQVRENICIFKELSDASAHIGISKEHLWSDWLDPLLPLGREHPNHSQIKLKFSHSPEGVLEVSPSSSKHRGPSNSRKLRIVCAKCNGGWMSEIEMAAKEVMTDLILGRSTVITVDQQNALCQWIMLKAIIGEYTDLPMMAISEADKMFLKNNRAIPPNWKIWIGNFLGGEREWLQKYSHTGGKIHMAGEPVPSLLNGQTTTFVINELFMHAASMPPIPLADWMPSRALLQIWPSSAQDIKWPPELPISDIDAPAIAYLMRDHAILNSPAKVAVFYDDPGIFNWVNGEPVLIDGE